MTGPSVRGTSDIPRRISGGLRDSAPGLVVLALVVGAGAAGGAVLFRYLIDWFTFAFTGRVPFVPGTGPGGPASPHFPGIGMFFLLLAPVLGGLIYGPLVDRFAKEARGPGVAEVMFATTERGGRIRPRVAAVKSLASALCIGSGGSVGREGPIVQISSGLGSSLGQLFRVPDDRLRLLVACGAAGGVSAIFNAPLAGVFFALELILRNFRAQSFGVVVLASVTADAIARAAFGGDTFLTLPSFELSSPLEYPFFAVLGVLAALAGVVFVRTLYGTEGLVDRLWKGPEWLRPGAGGLLLGALLLALPQLYGGGYAVLENAIRGEYVLWLLLALLAGKILASSLTIAIGGSGGVFAPALFMGATLGTAFGLGVNEFLPTVVGSPGAYGLVGMGAVFAGAARAPITAVLVIFELTGTYAIILPLMFAVSVAAGVSHLLSRDTIYTFKLRRRGVDVIRGTSANLMEVLTVADAMQAVPPSIPRTAPLNTVIERLADEERDALPVTDENGVYLGTVTARQVEESARANALESTAGSLAEAMPNVTPGQTLEQALAALVERDRTGMPVLSPDGRHVAGWLTHRDVLRTYNDRLQRSLEEAEAEQAGDPDRVREAGGRSAGASHAAGPPATVQAPAVQRSVARLQGYRVVNVELVQNKLPVGTLLSEVTWPHPVLILAIRRNGTSISATKETRLQRGDRLSLLVPADRVDEVVRSIGGLRRGSG